MPPRRGRPKKQQYSTNALVQALVDSGQPVVEEKWAQCERCEKWRRLPSDSIVDESRQWFCEMHPIPHMRSCDVAEEQYDQAQETKYVYVDNGSVATDRGIYTGIVDLKSDRQKKEAAAAAAAAAAGGGDAGDRGRGGIRTTLNPTRASKYQRAFTRIAQNQGLWEGARVPSSTRAPPFVWEGLFCLAPTKALAALQAVDRCTAAGYFKGPGVDTLVGEAAGAMLEAVTAALQHIETLEQRQQAEAPRPPMPVAAPPPPVPGLQGFPPPPGMAPLAPGFSPLPMPGPAPGFGGFGVPPPFAAAQGSGGPFGVPPPMIGSPADFRGYAAPPAPPPLMQMGEMAD